MCNLYRHRVKRWAMKAYFEAEDAFSNETPAAELDDGADADKVYPGYTAPIVRIHEGARQIIGASWGFPTRKPRKLAPKEGQSPFVITRWTNARDLDASLWKRWIAEPVHRCLVPFATFAEPVAAVEREAQKSAGGDGNWWFTVNDQDIPCFAGLWKFDNELGLVYAFLTTDPNPLVAPKHEKAMPVILARDDHQRWLTGSMDDVLQLQAPYPSQLMALTPA